MTVLLCIYIHSLVVNVRHDLTLDAELYLCDGKHGKCHAMSVHNPQSVSDWLNLHSLGTISAFGHIIYI